MNACLGVGCPVVGVSVCMFRCTVLGGGCSGDVPSCGPGAGTGGVLAQFLTPYFLELAS